MLSLVAVASELLFKDGKSRVFCTLVLELIVAELTILKGRKRHKSGAECKSLLLRSRPPISDKPSATSSRVVEQCALSQLCRPGLLVD